MSGFVHPHSHPRPAPPSPPPRPAVATAPAAAPTAAGLTPAESAALAQAGALLATDDLKLLVARLRAAGLPTAVTRHVVRGLLQEKASARLKELQPDLADLPYWKSPTRKQEIDPKRQAAFRDLAREQDRLLKEALGPELAADPAQKTWRRRQYGDLPENKIPQLERLNDDYNDLAQQARANGIMLPEDRAKLAFLEQEKRADLAKLLTPEELLAYDLRTSNTANQLRWQLGALDPTEAEFLAVYHLQKNFDDRSSGNSAFARGPATPEQAQQRRADEQALQAQVKAALGDARFAEYERARDGNFQQASRLVARLELPPATAVTLWDTQKSVEPRLRTIQSDRTLTNDQRTAQIAALAAEAKATVLALIGQRGLDAYKENGGWWLQNLEPRPAAPRPAGGQVIALPPKG